jgi:hypothetical protein
MNHLHCFNFFFCGVAVCRFAYSEDAGDEADEEGLSLVGSAVKGTGDMVNMHVFPEDKRA